MKDIIGTAQVLAKSNLFTSDVMEAFVPSGMSIREIIGNDFDNYAVTLNGEVITVEEWYVTTVDTSDVLTIVKIPQGDDSNAFKRLILIIAVIVIAYYLGPVAADAFGGLEAAWVSGLSFVGVAVVNLVLPPIMPEADDRAVKRLNSLTGTRNAFAPFEPIPIVYGRHRLYPPIAAMPRTEVIGSDQYLHMVYCIGLGEYDIDATTIKIGDTPATNFEDIDINITDSPDNIDIFELQQALTLNQDATPGDTFTRTTAADTERIALDFTFPAGLIKVDKSDGDEKSVQVGFSIEYRISGSSDPWLNVNDTTWEIDTRGRRRVINTNAQGYPPTKTSSYGALSVSGIDSDWVQAHAMTRDPIRVGIAFSPPTTDTWDVRVTRQRTNTFGGSAVTSASSNWGQFAATMAWTALRSISFTPAITLAAGTATFLTLRVRATDQLHGIIDSLNLIVTRELRKWNKIGQSFDAPVATRDPAWAYLDILTGLGNARPITDEAKYIWLDDLADWATANTAGDRYYDEVVDYRTSVFDALTVSCGVGRAALSNRDGKWTVILEQAAPTPVQYFTPRNSWGFNSVKKFLHFPHAFKVRFNSEDSGYQEDEMIVYDTGYDSGSATDFEVLQLQGITDADQAWRTGKYTLAALRLRPELYTFNADVEHIVAQRGDHILASHDIPLWGNSYGRITDINGNIVTTDEAVDLDGGTSYVMRVRLDDGTSVIEDLTAQGGADLYTHTFTPSIPAGIQVGDLYMIGEVGSETQELVVISVVPTGDLAAKIVCVDHNADILTADEGTPPVFDPNITLPIDPTQLQPVPPFNVTANSDQSVYPVDGSGVLLPRIVVSWDQTGHVADKWPTLVTELRWREWETTELNSIGVWRWIPAFNAFQGSVCIDGVSVGVEYEIEMRNTSEHGVSSFWTSPIVHEVGGSTRLPSEVDSLTATGDYGGVLLEVDFTSLIFRTGSHIEVAYGAVNDRDDVGTVIEQFAIPTNLNLITVLRYFVPLPDSTTMYFWVQVFDIYETASIWTPASATAGISATPLEQAVTVYYIKPTDGTAIHDGVGTLTIEAHKIEGGTDILLSSGTIVLYDPSNNIVNVTNGYQTGSDGYTGILDSTNINGDIVITLKDGTGGTPLDTITLVDIADGADGVDAVYGYIEPIDTLSWVREVNQGAWDPTDTSTNLDVTFVQGGAEVARWSRQIDRAGGGALSDGGAVAHSGGNLNTSRITPTIDFSTNLFHATITYDYVDGSNVSSISETIHAVLSGSHALFYYIKPIEGTAIKNGSGQLTIEAHRVTGGSDILLSSGTIMLYDESDDIVNVTNGYQTGSDGYTGILDSTNINNDIVITLKDGVAGDPLDTITLVDVADGASAIHGFIEPENGLAWVRQGTDGPWTPSQLTTDLDCTFVKEGADIARESYRLTLNSVTGNITGAPTTHPGGDLNTSRVTINPSGSGTTAFTTEFVYSFGDDDDTVAETVTSSTGGATGLPGQFTALEYDDLDTTQLAAGQSRYAMLDDIGDNTSGSQNNFHLTEGILINKKDVNGVNYTLLLSEIREGDRIVYRISATRWFIFVVTDTLFEIVGTGDAEAIKMEVNLLQLLDPDPTANISTSAGTDVIFEVHKSNFDISQMVLIDPDFDLSAALTGPLTSSGSPTDAELQDFPGNANFWATAYHLQALGYGGSPGTPSISLETAGGANGSNSVKFQEATFSGGGATPPYTQGLYLWHVHRFRTNNPSFTVRIRARNQHATLDSPVIDVRMYGYLDQPRGGPVEADVSVRDTTPFIIPANTQDYTEFTFHLEEYLNRPSESQYWGFRVSCTRTLADGFLSADLREFEIDSIFVEANAKAFGEVSYVGSTSYSPGLVPKSVSGDSGKYLKADGTWDDPPGGSSSDSFRTQTVTDTDSGYSWSETGSAVADSGTDTLTWVSGTDIDIDVDATSDAIRISYSGSGGDVSVSGTPVNNQLAIWTNATTIEGDANFTWDGSIFNVAGHLELGDLDELRLGSLAGGDAHITHSGTALLFDVDTGSFNLRMASNELAITAAQSGAVQLYYNAGLRLKTIDAGGIEVLQGVFITELSAANTDVAGRGQFWVRDDDPNTPMFTTDTGVDINLSALGGAADGTVTDATMRWSGSAWVEEDRIRISSAGGLSIFDSSLADEVLIQHNSADIEISIAAGSTGTINALDGIGYRSYDSTDVAFIGMDSDLTVGVIRTNQSNPIEIRPNSVTKVTVAIDGVTIEDPLYIDEQASASGDVSGYGQIWVLNSAPNELWFTRDNSADVPLSEIFDSSTQGQVPASGGGSTNFLRADATWVDPGTGGVASKPGVFRGSTNQSLSTGMITVDLVTELEDPDSNYSLASDIITIADAGYYLVAYQVMASVDTGGGNQRCALKTSITKNGTATALPGSWGASFVDENSTPDFSAGATCIHEFSANDTIRIRANISQNTDASTVAIQSGLSIMKVR